MSDHHLRSVEVLDGVAVTLNCGDWRTATLALSNCRDARNHAEVVDLWFCLRCVARAMRFQSAFADVEAARHQLDAAAGKLRSDGRVRLAAEPARQLGTAHLRWATTRLVVREQADLQAISRIFSEVEPGSAELVHAGVEHLTWIEFDPWTVRVHPLDRRLTGLDDRAYARWRVGNRHDMCARASNLRHLADVRSRSVGDKAWQDLGGYHHVREQALRLLASEPVTRGRHDLPVRLGRRRAWDYARGWVRDTAV